jgi:hypothetical protein
LLADVGPPQRESLTGAKAGVGEDRDEGSVAGVKLPSNLFNRVRIERLDCAFAALPRLADHLHRIDGKAAPFVEDRGGGPSSHPRNPQSAVRAGHRALPWSPGRCPGRNEFPRRRLQDTQPKGGPILATQVQTEQGIVRVPTGTWHVDPAHSSIAFEIKHMMIATVRGRFNEFEGTIIAAEDIADSRAFGKVKAASIDTGQPDRDAHLRSADFFDAERYPETPRERPQPLRRLLLRLLRRLAPGRARPAEAQAPARRAETVDVVQFFSDSTRQLPARTRRGSSS